MSLLKPVYLPVVFTLLCVFSSSLCAQQLIPYRKDSKWGFCTADKKIVANPVYDRVEQFKNGYAFVEKENKLGMVNSRGKEIIPCLYKDLYPLSDGLIRAGNNDLLYGYVDSTNKVVIPFQYSYASDFSKGIACVKPATGDCFLIDKKGKKISDDPRWVKETYPEYFLPFIVKTPCYAVKEEPPVVKGLSFIRKKNEKGNMRAFLVSESGQQLSKKGYMDINLYLYKISGQPFVEVFDYDKGNLYGLIDRNGKEVVPLQRSKFSDFYYGLAYNQTCLIDTTGKILLDSVAIYYASDRFIRVLKNDNMRYYDLKRRAFFPGNFVWGSSVSDGIAFVETDEGQEVSINLLTGKKKPLSDVQKKLKKFQGDDALECPWRSSRVPVLSKLSFRFLSDSLCFDKYYITDVNGTHTGAVVYSYSRFMNSITDKNGNKKDELSFSYVTPDMFAIVEREADTLIIMNSIPLLRDKNNVIATDPINKMVLSSRQSVVVDLKGNLIYEVTADGAKAYNKSGELVNAFPCYTCDGDKVGIINHCVTYDYDLKLFLTPMGYISADFKTAYFED